MDEWNKDGDREKKMLLDKAATRAELQGCTAKQPVLNREHHRLFSGMQARAKEFCCCY